MRYLLTDFPESVQPNKVFENDSRSNFGTYGKEYCCSCGRYLINNEKKICGACDQGYKYK